MKYSKYNFIFQSKKYGYLLYNSMTNSFATINEALYDLLIRIKKNKEHIVALDIETLNILKNGKIIIEDADELNHYYRKRFLYNYHVFYKEDLKLTIAPTTSCNFGCPYCYEEGKLNVTMSSKTIDDLISYIKNYNTKKNYITWYGGEPLLAVKKINEIIEKAKKVNIPLSHQNMITNGYYLTEKNQDFIIKNNIRNLQITLDGAQEIHDKRRFLKTSKKGTYGMIIKNIDSFLAKNHSINIRIRVNIDKGNMNSYLGFQKELMERWNNDSRVSIYPGIITGDEDNPIYSCSLMSNDDIADINLEISKDNKENAFFEYDVFSCGATNINTYVVGPEGELYKCWNEIGQKNKIIGHINNDEVPNPDVLYQYLSGPSMLDEKKCVDCPLFFVCIGGCPWERIQNTYENKNYNLCTHRLNHIDKYLELHYEKKIKKYK